MKKIHLALLVLSFNHVSFGADVFKCTDTRAKKGSSPNNFFEATAFANKGYCDCPITDGTVRSIRPRFEDEKKCPKECKLRVANNEEEACTLASDQITFEYASYRCPANCSELKQVKNRYPADKFIEDKGTKDEFDRGPNCRFTIEFQCKPKVVDEAGSH